MDLQEYKDTDTIDELWQKACQNFAKLTDKPLKKSQEGLLRRIDASEQVDTAPLLDRAVEQLRVEHEHADSNSSSKKAQAKHCARNVLNFVLLIGGIAAGAASSAFPPASTCWSAAEFLLQIPGKIDKYYAGVSDIFREMDGHLLTLGVYKRMDSKRIEPELHRSIHRVLISFVDICARAYCFTRGGKRERFWKVTKSVLADDDSGISESLKEFRQLLKAMSHVESAAILASGLRVEAHTERTEGKVDDIGVQVNELASAEKEKTLESEWREQIQQIMKTIGLEQHTVDEQDKAHRRHTARLLPKSTEEIRTSPEYETWFDFESDSHPLLLLSGAARSGKSHAASAIMDEVEYSSRNIENQKKAAPLIANFFFQSRAERGEKENVEQQKDTGQMLDKALKHMCIQIAKVHRPFCRDMARYCYGKKLADFQDKSGHELWEMLKLGSPRGNAVHLLVLDGIEMLPANMVTDLIGLLARQRSTSPEGSSASASPARLRIVATIQEEMATSVAIPPGVLRCDIADYSRGNAIKLIDDHFLKTTRTWDVSDESKKEFIQNVTDQMLEAGRCNFGYIEKRLKLIDLSYLQNENLKDVYETLEDNLEEDPGKYAMEILKHLNTDLSTTEIEKLNWLLAWVMYAPVLFTVEELKAVMYLQSRNKLDVRRKLNQYSKILTINEFKYVVVDEALDDYMRANQLPRSSSDGFMLNEAYVTMEVKIHHASINAVRKLMWSLSEPNALENLLAGAGQKHERGRVVGANRIEARLMILDRLLEILVDDPDETTEPLVEIAVEFIVRDALELDQPQMYNLLTPQDKMQVQKTLLTVLCDVHILEKRDIPGQDMRDNWLRGLEDISRLNEWLRDQEATNQLDPRDKRRLDRLLRDSAKCNVRLWHRVTVTMATRWLMSDRNPPRDAYLWVEGYLALHDESASAELKQLFLTNEWTSLSAPNPGNPWPQWSNLTDANKIEVALAWARANIPKHKENSLWFRRLAETYLAHDQYQEAIKAFQKSLALPGHHWLSNVGLANALYDSEQTKEAQAEMEKVIVIAEGQEDLDESEAKRLTQSLLQFALWQNPNDAIETCQKAISLEKTEFDYRFHFRLITAFQHDNNIPGAQAHALDMHSKRAQNGDFTRLAEAFEFWARDHPTITYTMDYFMNLLDDPKVKDAVDVGLREASQIATQKQLPIVQAKCELLWAFFLFQSNHDSVGFRKSLEISKKLCGLQDDNDSIDWDDVKVPYGPFELAFCCIFELARSEGVEKGNLGPFIDELSEVLEKVPPKSGFLSRRAAVLLARCKIMEDQVDKAREYLMRPLNEALDLLSDDDEMNDNVGFYLLARVLTYLGDDVNALQAWSLIEPLDPSWHEPKEELTSPNGDNESVRTTTGDLVTRTSTLDSTGLNGHEEDPSPEENASTTEASQQSNDVETNDDKSSASPQDESSPIVQQDSQISDTSKKPEIGSLGWLRVPKDDIVLWELQKAEEEGILESKEDADLDHVQIRGTQRTITDLLERSQKIENDPSVWSLNMYCSGKCGKFMHYPKGFHFCRCCAETLFCDDCFELAKQGKQKQVLCKPTAHEWLKVPKWNWDEYRNRGSDNVWTDGTIREEDGVVVGTQKVHWKVWLNGIRREWGIPEVEVELEGEGEGEGESESPKDVAVPAANGDSPVEEKPFPRLNTMFRVAK